MPVVFYGCESWSPTLRERCGISGVYLDLKGRNWQDVGENDVIGSFIICTPRQILLE
jgi:hypothetical protein